MFSKVLDAIAIVQHNVRIQNKDLRCGGGHRVCVEALLTLFTMQPRAGNV